MPEPAWYSGSPEINLEVEAQLAALAPGDIGAPTAAALATVAANLAALTPATIGAATAAEAIDAQTTAYVLVLTDAGKLVTVNDASASALTIQPNSSVAFPIGIPIDVLQLGAGQVTITAGAGVTVNQVSGTLKMLGQFAKVRLLKTAVNTWNVNGDLAAS